MLFNSLAYLLFLPIAFLVYWTVPGRWRNAVVVAASFVFYGWWDVRFLGLMVLTCAVNYAAALLMDAVARRRTVCALAVVFNFAVLGAFKYYDFFAGSLAALCRDFGWQLHPPVLHVMLPVGISFYTFQVTGYVVDVYRRATPATRDVLRFFAFISFFPQLVAGPIERSTQLLPQFARVQRFDRAQAVDGMRQILWGLMKKMVLADNCAAVADYAFAHPTTLSSADLWLGIVCFAFQIYGDFSGYSDMAVGSAKLFGIRLMKNFDRPYFARTIPDFWRRWHISLMTWFRDYVYIPLGGNRRGRLRQYANTAAVFAISGLWHGAGWTFVVWGLYHAALFLPYSLLRPVLARCGRWATPPLTLLTFLLVLMGWVVFRAPDMATAGHYLAGLFDPDRWGPTSCSRLPLLYIGLLVAAEAVSRREHPLALAGHGLLCHRAVRMALYYALFIGTLLAGGRPTEFIYFQF